LTIGGAILVAGIAASVAFAGFEQKPLTAVDTIPSQYQFGSNGTGVRDMLSPSGLVVDAQNQVYVADCALDRVQVFSPAGDFVRSLGPGQEKLSCPRGLAAARDGRLLVVDSGNRRVVAFDPVGKSLGTVVNDPLLVDPYAVSTDGSTIAVSDPGSDSIRFYTTTGAAIRACGTAGDAVGNFSLPLGISHAGDGTVFVADQQNARIQRLAQDCTVVDSWGEYGSYPGNLNEPADVRWVNGQVFVADQTNHRLQVFDENGNLLYLWGRHPSVAHEGNGRTHYPTFIAPDPRASFSVVCEPFEVRCQTFDLASVRAQVSNANDTAFWYKFPRFHYGSSEASTMLTLAPDAANPARTMRLVAIAEPDISQVVLLDWSGKVPTVHARLGGFGSAEGQFKQPAGIAMDEATGDIFVADANNNRVEVFGLDGQFIRAFGKYGLAPGEFNGPGRMAFDTQGNLVVAMVHGHRVDTFTKEGDLVRSVGKRGGGPLEFLGPMSVEANHRLHRLYVVDRYNQRVQMLAEDGSYIGEFGTKGIDPGEFIDPFDLAFDSADNVYVTDTATDRVQKFDANGKFILQWGSFGSELGQFYKPKGISVLEDKVTVIDFGNHRGQVFSLDGEPLGIFGEGILSPTKNTSDLFTPLTQLSEGR